jgi:uncharacterized protein (DUF2062 family)
MPQKFLRRHLPAPEAFQKNRFLAFLGDRLHSPNLWHLNRHSVARAVAVGMWAMYTPPLPWQQVIAAALAVYFNANLPLAVAMVFITNPLTWPPLYYIAYKVGALALGTPAFDFTQFSDLFTVDKIFQLGGPLLTGCFILMNLGAVLGYFGVQYFWRRSVLHRMELRKFRDSPIDSATLARESHSTYLKFLEHRYNAHRAGKD